MSADREMIADLLSALEYHQEQTRPIAMTRTAIAAAQHHLRSAAPAAPAAEPVAPMTHREAAAVIAINAAIWRIEHGQPDAAEPLRRARDLFAAAAPAQSREPLTDEQKLILWHKESAVHKRNSAFEWYAAGVEASERAHGIGSQP